jgi:hypothetical protein
MELTRSKAGASKPVQQPYRIASNRGSKGVIMEWEMGKLGGKVKKTLDRLHRPIKGCFRGKELGTCFPAAASMLFLYRVLPFRLMALFWPEQPVLLSFLAHHKVLQLQTSQGTNS